MKNLNSIRGRSGAQHPGTNGRAGKRLVTAAARREVVIRAQEAAERGAASAACRLYRKEGLQIRRRRAKARGPAPLGAKNARRCRPAIEDRLRVRRASHGSPPPVGAVHLLHARSPRPSGT